MNHTIAAYSGGSLPCAIGIIRISGPDAFKIMDRIFKPKAQMRYGMLHYGELHSQKNRLIDLCMGIKFKGPHTFTGEDMCELHCHGSAAVIEAALSYIYILGASPAEPGEFTKRAFLFGKMDLTAVEASSDLIYSHNESSAHLAAKNLSGSAKDEIVKIRDEVLSLLTNYYAVCDYPEEDIEPFEYKKAGDTLCALAKEAATLADSYVTARDCTYGVPVAILGKPNSGKSTLFNALSGKERAIVTEYAGTTRDSIDNLIYCNSSAIRLFDTAGLRDNPDYIEKIGIEKTHEVLEESRAALFIVDAGNITSEDKAAYDHLPMQMKRALVINKTDLMPHDITAGLSDMGIDSNSFDAVFRISAKIQTGLEPLIDWLSTLSQQPEETAVIISSARQAGLLKEAAQSLQAAADSAGALLTADAFLTDAEIAIKKLGEITGETADLNIATEIFSRFCVGK